MTTEPAEQPTDINELFHRNPSETTDEDITKIVAEYRRKRAMFQAAPNASKPKAKAAPKTPAAKAAAGLNLDLKL